MKITIINTEKSEKRYAREELDAFVSQLKDGTYHHHYIRDFNKDVCFGAFVRDVTEQLESKRHPVSRQGASLTNKIPYQFLTDKGNH